MFIELDEIPEEGSAAHVVVTYQETTLLDVWTSKEWLNDQMGFNSVLRHIHGTLNEGGPYDNKFLTLTITYDDGNQSVHQVMVRKNSNVIVIGTGKSYTFWEP